MAPKNNKILNKENELIEGEEFNEQEYLLYFVKQFSRQNSNNLYDNFSKISSNSPSVLLNKLLAIGVRDFINISHQQLSLLQPKFRIYKVAIDDNGQERDVELRFDAHSGEQRFEDVVSNSFQLGSGIGLKSFSWNDLGTHPGDSGVSFKANVELVANSSRDLFQLRNKSGEPDAAFSDLLTTSPKKIDQRGNINKNSFRIKVDVGWNAPQISLTESSLRFSKELLQAIKNTKVTMFLNLTSHTLSIQKTGKIDISIEFIGSIEGKLFSPESDLFYIDKHASKQVQNQNRLLKYYESKKKELDDKGVTSSWWKPIFKSDEELEFEALSEELQNRQLLLQNLEKENKVKAYSRFLTRLEESQKIFFFDLSYEKISIFQKNKMQNILGTTNNRNNLFAINHNNVKVFEPSGANQKALANINPSNPIGRLNNVENMKNIVIESDEEDREKKLKSFQKQFVSANKKKKGNVTRINYVYFGDIVDAALDVLRQNSDIKEKNNFKFLLGNFEIFDPTIQKSVSLNLADIPISLNLFSLWFTKKVIAKQKSKYLLKDFLRDICSELLFSALTPNPNPGTPQSVRNNVSFSVFSIPKTISEQIQSSKNISVEQINFNKRNLNEKNIEYFMIYISGYASNLLKGNERIDSSNGIYHFVPGADRGLLKYIEFKRADIQGQKESRIYNAQEQRSNDAFFSEPYNATVYLYGNSIFKPGMTIYIDDRLFNLNVNSKIKLPIGGYYNIIRVENSIKPGHFETILDCTFTNFADNPTQTSNVIINEQGSTSGDLDISSRNLKNGE